MSYQLEFRKLTVNFMEDIRVLARRELMEGLQNLYVFQRKKKTVTASASVPAKKSNSAHKPIIKPAHVPGGGVKCRAPGCRKMSKGPRYHYLCADHRTQPKSAKTATKRGEPLSQPKNGRREVAIVVPGSRPVEIEYHGLKLTQEAWSRKLGLNKDAVRHRMRRGCTPLEALTMEKSVKRLRPTA